jgi:galactokinase
VAAPYDLVDDVMRGPDQAGIDASIGAYHDAFGSLPSVVSWAPGRINLIGEHIDYCGGTVLPFGIASGTWVAAGDGPDAALLAGSDQYATIGRASLAEPQIHSETIEPWVRYPRGVWQELVRAASAAPAGPEAPGHALFLRGALMTFGGLSSSASLCLATAVALARRLGLSIGESPLDLALLCQAVEHRHLGVACGIMDQAAIALARPGMALALRCDTLAYQYVPLPLHEHAVLAVHSGVPRALAGSAYNARQNQVRAAEAVLRQRLDLPNACALAPERLADVAKWFDPEVRRRLRHVVTEQSRVQVAIAALTAADLDTLGRAMGESHASLRDDFEVSCPELDLIHERALTAGALGARLTGAGFGGVAIVLAERRRLPGIAEAITAAFVDSSRPRPRMFIAETAGPARLVWQAGQGEAA